MQSCATNFCYCFLYFFKSDMQIIEFIKNGMQIIEFNKNDMQIVEVKTANL